MAEPHNSGTNVCFETFGIRSQRLSDLAHIPTPGKERKPSRMNGVPGCVTTTCPRFTENIGDNRDFEPCIFSYIGKKKELVVTLCQVAELELS